ncbi:hypothetical protein K2Z84_29675 [Candidatus Binatia bacterium]|nr:hypothetical protein [Candidatus Binatia bacterium]
MAGRARALETTEATGLAPHQREFLLEEYKQLRAELGVLSARRESLLRYAVIIAAGVFAWLISQGLGRDSTTWCLNFPRRLYVLSWYIPFAFSLLCGVASVITSLQAGAMRRYLADVEQVLAVGAGQGQFGWERQPNRGPRLLATIGGVLAWLILMGATCYKAYEVEVFTADKEICPNHMPPSSTAPESSR